MDFKSDFDKILHDPFAEERQELDTLERDRADIIFEDERNERS